MTKLNSSNFNIKYLNNYTVKLTIILAKDSMGETLYNVCKGLPHNLIRND